MTWHPHPASWRSADVDAAALWRASGGQWLSPRATTVPDALVRQIAGLVAHVDNHGAGLAASLPGAGIGVVGERAAVLGLPPAGEVSCGGAARLLRCADGFVAVALARPDDEALVPAWLEIDPSSREVWDIVASAIRERSAAQLVDRASLLGLACSSLGEAANRRDPVLVDRVGDAPPVDLDGLVVADLASLWAGPLAADTLRRVGARVVKVESTLRPDGGRGRPEFFDLLHGGQNAVALDLTDDHGVAELAALLRSVDVVIEGSRPRALSQLGIDARALAADGPQLWVSITAHGREEPHARRIGFGDDAAAAGGLVAGTHDAPAFLADAVADPLAGLTAAAAVIDLATAGGRWMVDVALARAASAAVGDSTAGGLPLADPVPPRRRRGSSVESLPTGRDTDAVLRELGVRS